MGSRSKRANQGNSLRPLLWLAGSTLVLLTFIGSSVAAAGVLLVVTRLAALIGL